MHYLNTLYSGWLNHKHQLVGHVFQGRFHSIPVEEDTYFKVVCRYIHLNPVRAHIVTRPEDYIWSDYRRLIRGEPDPLVDPSFLLNYFIGTFGDRREKYRLFVEDFVDKQEPVTDKVLQRMRFWGKSPKELRRSPFALSQ